MKVSRHVVAARREELARLLAKQGYLPVREVCDRLGISEATARRDLAALAQGRRLMRTYGGAVADLSAFDRRFPSFLERRKIAAAAKRRIAERAWKEFTPGTTIFLDSGTTPYAIAEELAARPVADLCVVTCNLPAAELLANTTGIRVCVLAGELLPRQSVLLGEYAARSAGFWRYDVTLLGAEGVTHDGAWNSNENIASFQRAVAAASCRILICADASKIGRKTETLLLPWSRLDGWITDATHAEAVAGGIPVPI